MCLPSDLAAHLAVVPSTRKMHPYANPNGNSVYRPPNTPGYDLPNIRQRPLPSFNPFHGRRAPPPGYTNYALPTKVFPFFDLPGEIRNIIYEFCLTGQDVVPSYLNGNFQVPCAAILRTCRQIYCEARGYLYPGKTFKISIYHDVNCVRRRGWCERGVCLQRCIRVDWGANIQTPPIFQRPNHRLMPLWTRNIRSARIELDIDPVCPFLVTRGNLLAALNSFLHIFADYAQSLEILHIRFLIRSGIPVISTHFYTILFPATRCPNLRLLTLENIPNQTHLQNRLFRHLSQPTTPCPSPLYNNLTTTVTHAQQTLYAAQILNIEPKLQRKLAAILKKPCFQLRTRCEMFWIAAHGSMLFQVPYVVPMREWERVGTQQGMMSLCKGERYYERLARADVRELQPWLHLLAEAVERVLVR